MCKTMLLKTENALKLTNFGAGELSEHVARPYSTAMLCLQWAAGPCPTPHSHCDSSTIASVFREMSTMYDTALRFSAHTDARTKQNGAEKEMRRLRTNL